MQLTETSDYKEEVTLVLSSARADAARSIQRAQQQYKKYYDRKSNPTKYHIGEWVLVRFPSDETGKWRKLSRPWHGPFRIIKVCDSDVTISNVYFPQDKDITVHQNRVKACPSNFPAGFYWYGGKRQGTGQIPRWVENILSDHHTGNSTDHPALDGQEEQDAEPMHNSVIRYVTDVLEEPADLDNDEPTYSVTPLQDYDHYTQDHTPRNTMPYVTVFWKTDHLDTRTKIHLLPVRDRHTHALSRNTKH